MPQMVVKKSPVNMEWSRMQGMTMYWVRFVKTDKTSISMEIMRAARETLTLVENHLTGKHDAGREDISWKMREVHRNKGMLVNQEKGEVEEQVDKESGQPVSILLENLVETVIREKGRLTARPWKTQ